MKNINTNFKKLLFVGLLSTTFTACKKDDMPASYKDAGQTTINSNEFTRRGRTNNNYSDTFRLVSFTGTSTKAHSNWSSTGWVNWPYYFDLQWSFVGGTNVAYYSVDLSTDAQKTWATGQKRTILNSTNDLYKTGSTWGYNGGNTYTNYFRLHFVLKDSSVVNSKSVKYTFD